MPRIAALAAVLVLCAAAARAQDPSRAPERAPSSPVRAESTDVAEVPDPEPALEPGRRAPDFALESSLGRIVKSKELRGGWSVIVFSPGRTRFAPLSPIADSLAAAGARVYGMCQDGATVLASYARTQQVPFTMLSDPTGQVAQLFGFFDAGARAIQPGLAVVDARGIVRSLAQSGELGPDDVLAAARRAIRGD